MSNEKRERQRANRMERIRDAERAEARIRRTRLIIRWTVIIGLALLAAFLYSVLSGDSGDDEQVDAGDAATDEQAATEGDEAAPTTAAGPAATALPDPPNCPASDGSSPRTTQFDAPPQLCIDPEVIYAADFVTSAGNFTAILDPELDLTSVNNFIVLARYHAYDGTIFHRVIDTFVIQGGDVQNLYGIGNPGYRFTGAFPPEDEEYRLGSVAMANSGNPGSNGSQFFIVTGVAGESLPANYSLLGRVTNGLEVPLAVQSTETGIRDIDGRPVENVPTTDVVVESVTVRTATEDEINAYSDG